MELYGNKKFYIALLYTVHKILFKDQLNNTNTHKLLKKMEKCAIFIIIYIIYSLWICQK